MFRTWAFVREIIIENAAFVLKKKSKKRMRYNREQWKSLIRHCLGLLDDYKFWKIKHETMQFFLFQNMIWQFFFCIHLNKYVRGNCYERSFYIVRDITSPKPISCENMKFAHPAGVLKINMEMKPKYLSFLTILVELQLLYSIFLNPHWNYLKKGL